MMPSFTSFSLDQAVALDPGFALAQARRAYALWSLASHTGSKDRTYIDGLKDAALAGATKAVALAPELAWAHLALGFAMGRRLPDIARQEAEFVRARELAPGDATALQLYANFEGFAGRRAASVEAAEQTVALDPLKPAPYFRLAWTYYYARRYDDALVALRRARALGLQGLVQVSGLSGMIALMQGRADVARADCGDDSQWVMNICLAIAYHALGRQSEAEAQLAKLHRTGSGAYGDAEIYAQWGRPDDALHWLDTAFNLPDIGIIQMRADPLLDPIRDTPHFKELERRLNFPG